MADLARGDRGEDGEGEGEEIGVRKEELTSVDAVQYPARLDLEFCARLAAAAEGTNRRKE